LAFKTRRLSLVIVVISGFVSFGVAIDKDPITKRREVEIRMKIFTV